MDSRRTEYWKRQADRMPEAFQKWRLEYESTGFKIYARIYQNGR